MLAIEKGFGRVSQSAFMCSTLAKLRVERDALKWKSRRFLSLV